MTGKLKVRPIPADLLSELRAAAQKQADARGSVAAAEAALQKAHEAVVAADAVLAHCVERTKRRMRLLDGDRLELKEGMVRYHGRRQ